MKTQEVWAFIAKQDDGNIIYIFHVFNLCY
ncbi:MAG: hypothetical protein K0S41_1862 [Anaerocolumna sp.]|jgi:hypothetical protein|nr:hypothetical protein [Anaerocolumna sp.]